MSLNIIPVDRTLSARVVRYKRAVSTLPAGGITLPAVGITLPAVAYTLPAAVYTLPVPINNRFASIQGLEDLLDENKI